jgi:hypothetical protein
MDHKTFSALTANLLSQASRIRNEKAVEYESEIDRLANFRKAAVLQNCSIPVAISGMMAKHTVSIYDMIETEFNNMNIDPPYTLELWREKLIDQINYLLLLYAAIREARPNY